MKFKTLISRTEIYPIFVSCILLHKADPFLKEGKSPTFGRTGEPNPASFRDMAGRCNPVRPTKQTYFGLDQIFWLVS